MGGGGDFALCARAQTETKEGGKHSKVWVALQVRFLLDVTRARRQPINATQEERRTSEARRRRTLPPARQPPPARPSPPRPPLLHPLTTQIGRSRTALREIPASWHVSTTAVTSLYDSGASSITNLGEATRIAIPLVLRPSKTWW